MRIVGVAAGTHQGARDFNEDSVLRAEQVPLFAVADGMGGPGAGDVAATIALESLRRASPELKRHLAAVSEAWSTETRLALSKDVDRVFNLASREIRSEAAALGMPGMGTTLTMATFSAGAAYIAHVGDSRAYLYRDGGILRLTEDHSIAELHLRRGRITREEYSAHTDRNVLYQTLGAGTEVDVDVAEVRLVGGDVLLLCTDGLIRALTEEQISDKIDPADLDRSLRALIRAANDAGAPDNMGVVLVAFEKERGDQELKGLTTIMKRCFLFRPLSEPEQLVIAPYLEDRIYEKGETIIEEGQPGDSFFVIVAGRVRVSRGALHLTDLRAGKHFGELSLARPVPRSATVTAIGKVRCLELTRNHFNDIVANKPDLGARMAIALLDTVGDRLRDLSERLDDVERAARGEFRTKTRRKPS